MKQPFEYLSHPAVARVKSEAVNEDDVNFLLFVSILNRILASIDWCGYFKCQAWWFFFQTIANAEVHEQNIRQLKKTTKKLIVLSIGKLNKSTIQTTSILVQCLKQRGKPRKTNNGRWEYCCYFKRIQLVKQALFVAQFKNNKLLALFRYYKRDVATWDRKSTCLIREAFF